MRLETAQPLHWQFAGPSPTRRRTGLPVADSISFWPQGAFVPALSTRNDIKIHIHDAPGVRPASCTCPRASQAYRQPVRPRSLLFPIAFVSPISPSTQSSARFVRARFGKPCLRGFKQVNSSEYPNAHNNTSAWLLERSSTIPRCRRKSRCATTTDWLSAQRRGCNRMIESERDLSEDVLFRVTCELFYDTPLRRC